MERLIKKISELGFEVGYKNHSEIGWVLREYNALIKEAVSIGIKSPETYYNEGKIKGKASRDRGNVDNKFEQERKIVSDKVVENEDESPKKKKTISYSLLAKPDSNNLPRLVEKISMIEVPRILEGFRFFNRK